MKIDLDRYRVKPKSKVKLLDFDPADDGGLNRARAEGEFVQLQQRLDELQELLYANQDRALLVVFQAMDTGGKDGTIRDVFDRTNPQALKITAFKAPSETERRHDFLWRVHQAVPPHGYIGVFNRSHYEEVLIARVHELVPVQRWKPRYDHINAFEAMLADEGIATIKFFLHISADYQKRRLERRLARADKLWKFNPDDLSERARWDDYQQAYQDALRRCSTDIAPWYVIPAEHHWYRNLLVARAIVGKLENFDMKFPAPTFDPKTIVVK